MSGAAIGALGGFGAAEGAELSAVLLGEAAVPGLGWALLAVTVVAVGAYVVLNANSSAEKEHSSTKPGAVVECPDKADEIPCFNAPPNGDPKEFERQLQEQEDGINDMSPDEILDNMAKYKPGARSAEDVAARREARAAAERAKLKELRKKYRGQPNADDLAESETEEFMKSVDATHGPDSIVGGDEVTGVGGSSENRSIGSQWAKKAESDTKTRAGRIKEAAERAKKAGKKKMNVKLKKC
jgi:predicted Zn-dependent protease